MEQIGYGILWCGIIIITYLACQNLPNNDWVRLILSGGICILVPNIVIAIIFRERMGFVLSYLKGKK